MCIQQVKDARNLMHAQLACLPFLITHHEDNISKLLAKQASQFSRFDYQGCTVPASSFIKKKTIKNIQAGLTLSFEVVN